jgi:hypothetical protein
MNLEQSRRGTTIMTMMENSRLAEHSDVLQEEVTRSKSDSKGAE